MNFGDFPGGAGDENPPANAGDTGSIPGPERFHTLRSNQVRALQLLSLRTETAEAHPGARARSKRRRCTERPMQCSWGVAPALHMRESPCAAKNKYLLTFFKSFSLLKHLNLDSQ